MKHQYLNVTPQLSNYVRTILVLDDFPNSVSSHLPLFTAGMSTLLCKIEDSKIKITIHGQSAPEESWLIENANQQIIAFFFKPFLLGSIFKLSVKELQSAPVDLNVWNPQKAVALNLILLNSSTTEEMVDVLNYFILTQVQANEKECKIIKTATDKLMQDSSPEALSLLLKDLALTERTFQRIFKKYTGITPNEYRRICQFYYAFIQLKDGSFNKLSDVAYLNGYFDQSHFIRSFKEFAKTTPNDYLKTGLKRKGK